MTSAINRYYDPSTDQFVSIDPDVATTNQPYVFTNDDPLNGEDPTGLCFVICSIVHAVSHVADDVTGFVGSNTLALVGLSLDTGSFVLDAAAAVSDDPALSLAGAAMGFAGTVVSAVGCKRDGGLACVGLGIGAAATTAGIAELALEAAEVSPDASALLKGAGYTLGGAAVTLDVAEIVVKVDEAVKTTAKKVATTVVKKK